MQNFYSWIRLRKKELKLSIIRHKIDKTIDLADIEKAIDGKTMVLAIS